MPWRIGVDIGGTFTDVALVEEDSGRIAVAKVLTTPPDFGAGVMEGLREGLSRHGIAAADATLLSHATTVVTNALLEGKGARGRLCRDPRLPRRAGAAPQRPQRPLRPVPGRPFRAHPPPPALRDRRPHRRPGRGGGAARGRRGAGAGGGDPRFGRGHRRGVADVLLPERQPRAPPRRAAARRPAAGSASVPLVGGAARDTRVRARQHHGGLRLRRPVARGLPRAAASGRRRAGLAAAPRHGQQRRRARRGGVPAHAGRGGRVRPGRRRGRGGAGRPPDSACPTCCPSTWAAPRPRPA